MVRKRKPRSVWLNTSTRMVCVSTNVRRVVRIGGVWFSDAKQARRAAAWLLKAADWLEEK